MLQCCWIALNGSGTIPYCCAVVSGYGLVMVVMVLHQPRVGPIYKPTNPRIHDSTNLPSQPSAMPDAICWLDPTGCCPGEYGNLEFTTAENDPKRTVHILWGCIRRLEGPCTQQTFFRNYLTIPDLLEINLNTAEHNCNGIHCSTVLKGGPRSGD